MNIYVLNVDKIIDHDALKNHSEASEKKAEA
jgi:hypothetical protein